MATRPVSVVPARLERNAEGTPYSADFGDIFHSTDGGLAQARHVFLEGNALPLRWSGRDTFTILETGFGFGLNFAATWQAWRSDSSRSARLHFVSIEQQPFAAADLAAALAPFDELRDLAAALGRAWPPSIAGYHRLRFEGGRVTLTLLFGDVQEMLASLDARVDAFFLDGFAPARNPRMWSPEVVREMARLAAPGCTLATWTVAGGVRAALADAGFRVEKRTGFGSKREMLAGVLESEIVPVRHDRRAVVIGAGLAGTLVGERLAAHGWSVAVLDERSGRSSARVGLLRPIANLRDGLNAQISRTAFLYALQHYRSLQSDGYHLDWNPCGVLQLAQDDAEEARFAVIANGQGYPADFLEPVDRARAREICGHATAHGGWWFRSGAVVSIASLGVASVASAGSGLRQLRGRRVARIEREGSEWRALDADARVIAEAPILVMANAADAARLIPEARLRLSAVRGQVTYLPHDPRRRLDVVVSGNGYVAPLPDGGHAAGATYAHDDFDPSVRPLDHQENLLRIEALLPGFTAGLEPVTLDGWTGFRATVPDRLPIYGPTSLEGLYAATGLGSRGLLWAPLGAELLACQLDGDVMPLPRDLAAAISPRRFLS